MAGDSDIYYRAVTARDSRFDGVFFTGVRSTGIYCRPVCPARTPRRKNCIFFPSAAAAEASGFRPCLRCRPELAPHRAPTETSRRVARVAAARIAAGELDDGGSVSALAKNLGISDRQLRRVLRAELGAGPLELAQTRRLLLARQLLTETRLPIVQVALASGFSSVRRFNAALKNHYGTTPRTLRQRSSSSDDKMETITLRIAYRAPFCWSTQLAFLRPRLMPGVETIDGKNYLRTATCGDVCGWLRLRPRRGNARASAAKDQAKRDELALDVSASLVPELPRILAGVRRLFDLDTRPDLIDAHLARDPRLAGSVRKRPGLRVPGAFDGFEIATRAILGQQVTVKSATTLVGRLVREFGETASTPYSELCRRAPTAERIAATPVRRLAKIGLPAQRAAALRLLAVEVHEGRLALEPTHDPELAIGLLRALPGIGPWTAGYIAMRALCWPDAFPEQDVMLRKSVKARSFAELTEIAASWRPWRSYAVAHLWAMNLRNGEP